MLEGQISISIGAASPVGSASSRRCSSHGCWGASARRLARDVRPVATPGRRGHPPRQRRMGNPCRYRSHHIFPQRRRGPCRHHRRCTPTALVSCFRSARCPCRIESGKSRAHSGIRLYNGLRLRHWAAQSRALRVGHRGRAARSAFRVVAMRPRCGTARRGRGHGLQRVLLAACPSCSPVP